MALAIAASTRTGLSDVHLGRLLQERGVINEHQLLEALRAQAASGGRLGAILVRRGCLSDAQLEAALRTQDEMRRAGVTLDLAVVAPGEPIGRAVSLALSVAVPNAGSQGGLPHHGVAARQQLLLPRAWLPASILAADLTGAGHYELTAEDGRMVDYGVELSLRASDEPIPLLPGLPRTCPAVAPRSDGYAEVTVLVRLSPDSLRDGGAGRFTGRFELRFAPPG